MGPWRGVASRPLASEMPKGEAKLALSEVRKQLWMYFQAVTRLHFFIAHNIESKMQILPSRSISRLTLMACPHSFQEISIETYAHWISPTEKT